MKGAKKIERDLIVQDEVRRLRSALITDIDNTFYYASHRQAVAAAWQLRVKATGAPYPIVGVTGANYSSVWRRIYTNRLPIIETIVSSVGTEIWQLHTHGRYVQDMIYDHVMRSTGYDDHTVRAACIDEISELRRQGFDVWLQDTSERYKVSLYFFGIGRDVNEITEAFQRRFRSWKIVVCEEINYNMKLVSPGLKKYCLDILPATKATAVRYLVEQLNLERGVVAGDSGNDTDMLVSAPEGFIAVAVGGHTPELGTNLNPTRCWIDTSDRRGAQSLLLFDDYLCGGRFPDISRMDKSVSTD